MPVQINEVIIRATVGGSGSEAAAENCGPENTDGSRSASSSAENDLAELILEIIKSKNER